MNPKALVAILLLSLLIAVFLPISAPGMGEADFIAYWSSARLLVQGENPYNQFALSALQQSAQPQRFSEQGVVISAWNPPWLMLVFLPIGLLPFNLAVHAWIFCSLALVGISLALAWQMVVQPFDERGFLVVLSLGLIFIDTLVMIVLGQITSLVLAGVVLGIACIHKKRDALAGAAFVLAAVKPHLTYLVFVALLVWIIRTRRWKVLAGLAGGALLSIAVVTLIYPGWIASYYTLMIHLPYGDIDTSTLGSFLLARYDFPYLRFVGVLLLPLAFPLARLAQSGKWLTAANLALMISIPLAPYGFGVDHVMLLPAFVEIGGWMRSGRLSGWKAGRTIVGVLFVGLLMTLMPKGAPNHDSFWVPLAVLAVYSLALKAVKS